MTTTATIEGSLIGVCLAALTAVVVVVGDGSGGGGGGGGDVFLRAVVLGVCRGASSVEINQVHDASEPRAAS